MRHKKRLLHRLTSVIFIQETVTERRNLRGMSAIERLEGNAYRDSSSAARARRSRGPSNRNEYTDSPTGFADAYPLLIANEASRSELSARLSDPVPMNRFRPNVVVDGPCAWHEDGWSRIQLGSVILDAVKPCSRCAVITTDQVTGARASREPLKTLASYRTMPGLGAIFGMNLVPTSANGTLRVGDPLTVLNYTKPHV